MADNRAAHARRATLVAFTVTVGGAHCRERAAVVAAQRSAGAHALVGIHRRHAVAVLDGYHQLAHADIDATKFIVKKGATPIDASAYELIPSMGLLQITDETAAAAGEALVVSYSTKLVTKTVIEGAKVTSFRGKVVVDGKNDVTGDDAKLTIHNVSLAVNGDFDWFSDDYNAIEMVGTASVGKNGESPYSVDLYDPTIV